jgi:hypothetical protein
VRRYNGGLMIGSVFAVVSAILGQNAESAKPKVNRTGEAAFRTMLAEISGKRKFHGMILKSVREGGRQDFYPEGVVEVWRDGDKFRVDFGDMWGSSNVIVSDGKRIMEDTGMDPVIYRDSVKSWVDSSGSMGAQGQASSPWFYLIEGPALLDRLDKDKEIVPGPTPNSIVWDSSLFGKITITKSRSEKELEVWEFEFDNMAWQSEMFKAYPEWFDQPNASSRWRQKVVLTPGGFPRGVFNTTAGKGREISDLTKRAKKPPESQD